jgi:hypothetical protein
MRGDAPALPVPRNTQPGTELNLDSEMVKRWSAWRMQFAGSNAVARLAGDIRRLHAQFFEGKHAGALRRS